MQSRWRFPLVEGTVVDENTGRWSQSAFATELLSEEQAECWHQAEPQGWVSDLDAWRRWNDYLETDRAAETILQLARLASFRRMRELEKTTLPSPEGVRRSKSPFLVPMLSPDEVRAHLGKPTQWKPLRSACELATAWFTAGDIPLSVRTILDSCEDYRGAALLHGIFEHGDDIEKTGRSTQTDLMLTLKLRDGFAAVAIEGKVDEAFGPKVEEWRKSGSPGKKRRLQVICDVLGLSPDAVDDLFYQLLHRSYAAVAQARRYGTKRAMMLVHSFSEANPTFAGADRFEDLQVFAHSLRVPLPARNSVSEPVALGDVEFRIAWVTDKPVSAIS